MVVKLAYTVFGVLALLFMVAGLTSGQPEGLWFGGLILVILGLFHRMLPRPASGAGKEDGDAGK